MQGGRRFGNFLDALAWAKQAEDLGGEQQPQSLRRAGGLKQEEDIGAPVEAQQVPEVGGVVRGERIGRGAGQVGARDHPPEAPSHQDGQDADEDHGQAGAEAPGDVLVLAADPQQSREDRRGSDELELDQEGDGQQGKHPTQPDPLEESRQGKGHRQREEQVHLSPDRTVHIEGRIQRGSAHDQGPIPHLTAQEDPVQDGEQAQVGDEDRGQRQ